MGFKSEIKHEIKNVLHDIDLSVTKTWEISYKEQMIRFENSMSSEKLFINDELVAENVNKSFLSHLKPSSKLVGTMDIDGRKRKVIVKLGGLVQLTVTIKVGNKVILKEKMKVDVLPWENKEKIVDFLSEQYKEHGVIVKKSLPDEAYLLVENDEEMAPAYRDYLGYDEPLPFFVKGLVKNVKEVILNPTLKTRRKIYEKVQGEYVRMYGAHLIYELEEADIDKVRLQEEAMWFLENAAHREVVKFALLLLGLTDAKQYEKMVFQIALHEEFTSYAIFPLQNRTLLWQLANELRAWGKIAVMHSLDAKTAEEKKWFLMQEWDNNLLQREAALLTAETAELDVLLHEEIIEETTFLQIGKVIHGLVTADEEEQFAIDEYHYAYSVLNNFLRHVQTMGKQEEMNEVLVAINKFIMENEEQWEMRFANGWEKYEWENIVIHLKTIKI